MAEHTDPGNLTQEQIEDQAWDCFRMRSQGHTIQQIAGKLELSRETVKRRLNEKILSHEVTPREVVRAMADARLDILTMNYLASLDTAHSDEVPKLLHAAIAVEKRRAALHGLDAPQRQKVEVTNGVPAEELPDPRLPQWLEELQASELGQRLEWEARGEG
jgi:Helix-turn-helix domain of resolvase